MRGNFSRLSCRQFPADSDLVLYQRLVSPQKIGTYACQYQSAQSHKEDLFREPRAGAYVAASDVLVGVQTPAM